MHLVPPYKASINMMTKPCHMRLLTPVKHLHFYFACPSAVKPNFYLQSSQFSAHRGVVIKVSCAQTSPSGELFMETCALIENLPTRRLRVPNWMISWGISC